MLPRSPRCPAALGIAGACASQQGVICRIMQRDQAEDDGLDMSPGQLEIVREGEGGVYLNMKSDPSTVAMFCHGDGVPVLTDGDGQGRSSYTYCPTWQQRRERDLAGADEMFEPLPREPVSMGIVEDESAGNAGWASHEQADPWSAAREGMKDLLG